jgi:hypothetical protein
MPPTRRSNNAGRGKREGTIPTTNTNRGAEQAERNSGELEFESELSGAFSLLSVEGSPSKVRTSDLGKLLLAIGAGEIAEIKPLESIVDINHSGFFTREKVRLSLPVPFFFVAEFFFQPRENARGGERRREPKAFLFLTKSFVLILTSRIFSLSGYRRVTKTSRTRPFPILGRAFRSLRLWAEGVDGCEKQATTKTVKRRGTDESKQIQRDEEDFSGGRYWIVQTGTFSMGRFRCAETFVLDRPLVASRTFELWLANRSRARASAQWESH